MTIENIDKEIRWADIGKPFLLKHQDKVISVKIERANEPENPREYFDPIGTMLCWHPRYKLGDYNKNPYGDIEDALADMVCEHVPAKDIFEYVQTGKSDGLSLTKRDDGTLAFRNAYDQCDLSVELPPEEYDQDGYQFQAFVKYIVKEMDVSDTFWLLTNKTPDIVVLPIWMYEHSGISLSTAHSYPYNDRYDSSCVGFVYATKADGVKHGAWLDDFSDSEWHELAKDELRNEVKLYSAYLEGDVYECSYSEWYGLNLDEMQLCARDGRPVYVVHKDGTSYWGIMDAHPNNVSNCCVHSWHDGKECRDYLSSLGMDWDAFDAEVDVAENTPEAQLATGDGFTDQEYGGYYYGFDDDTISDMADFIGEALNIYR